MQHKHAAKFRPLALLLAIILPALGAGRPNPGAIHGKRSQHPV